MECNRDEAIRAKSIAEDKLEKKDFTGAKKFALKAQNLYPLLDGICPLLTTIDIYVFSENKINGEVDWYGVLGVNPSSDDEAIRRQYRKLALMLHPDKNKSVGADGAFKLISEAWSFLSDKQKRFAYNQRRVSGVQQKVPSCNNAGQSAPFRANNGYKFSSNTTSVPKARNNGSKMPAKSTHTPFDTRTDTFWTICNRCKIHYEFVKEYLNNTLLCPNCQRPFEALATDPPSEYTRSLPKDHPCQRQEPPREHVPSQNAYDPGRNAPLAAKKPGAGKLNYDTYANYQQAPVSGKTRVVTTDPSIAAKAANVIQQAQEKLKRAYTESKANTSTGWEEYLKKRKVDFDSSSQYNYSGIGQQNSSFGTGRAPGSRIFEFSHRQPNSTRDLTPAEIRNMLLTKARKEIINKLNLWKLAEAKPNAIGKVKGEANEKEKERNKSTSGNQEHEDSISNLPKSRVAGESDNPSREVDEEVSMTVPDPDFYDFDSDRTEMSFGENEVWAAYDDDDGMPRFYALISKVVSKKPFNLKISWLNSKTNNEFSSTVQWVKSGFYKTCGEFRVGKYESSGSINAFSQKVSWSKNSRGSILIYPQKNHVWALYKNWSHDWNEHTPDDIIHKYDMVMVVEDFNNEHGVSVAPLVKVVGFKTVFRPNLNQQAIKRIPKEEMFRFSHRVPYHLLSSQEAQSAPNGCVELDPAATPLELLQVINNTDPVDGKKAF